MRDSPYKAEAATARRIAKRMLKAHGWTLSDLSEPVVEEVQEPEPEPEPEPKPEPENEETPEEFNRRLYEGLSPKEARAYTWKKMRAADRNLWSALFHHYFRF